MPVKVLMPALSPTMKDGKIVKWLKQEGQKINSGDVLAEVETDKATMEIEAFDDGILAKILAPSGGEKVLVNSPIAILLQEDEENEDIQNFSLSSANLDPVSASASSSAQANLILNEKNNLPDVVRESTTEVRIKASPLAKKIAAQQNIDLTKIKGSGPGGRIIKQDICSYPLKELPVQSKENPFLNLEAIKPPEDTIIAVNGMREVIAQRLSYSKQNIPHFYLVIDCNLDKLLILRNEINAIDSLKITINDFIIKAVALSMHKNPQINASWEERNIRQYNSIDIAIAVGLENGLITPILRNANKKPLQVISQEVKDLVERAKIGKLNSNEYMGGGFTISNLGMFGIREFSAIINPPQSCILAVGAAEKRPIISKENTLEIATLVTVTLSCDHRVVDGLLGANFLKDFKKIIENPLSILI